MVTFLYTSTTPDVVRAGAGAERFGRACSGRPTVRAGRTAANPTEHARRQAAGDRSLQARIDAAREPVAAAGCCYSGSDRRRTRAQSRRGFVHLRDPCLPVPVSALMAWPSRGRQTERPASPGVSGMALAGSTGQHLFCRGAAPCNSSSCVVRISHSCSVLDLPPQPQASPEQCSVPHASWFV